MRLPPLRITEATLLQVFLLSIPVKYCPAQQLLSIPVK
jgi:hypothetical protein